MKVRLFGMVIMAVGLFWTTPAKGACSSGGDCVIACQETCQEEGLECLSSCCCHANGSSACLIQCDDGLPSINCDGCDN